MVHSSYSSNAVNQLKTGIFDRAQQDCSRLHYQLNLLVFLGFLPFPA
jgi:hypothetical protein